MSNYTIYNCNMLEEIEKLEKDSIDSIITDPPYELNFMGKDWDNAGVSYNKHTWEKCLRVLKPGGYLLAFGGSRTFHRIACAIEDAGFEIKDTIMWVYGSGFPKSMNIGLEVDKKVGNESKVVGSGKSGVSSRAYQSLETTTAGSYEIKEAQNEWNGWGTQLKPAFEPIIVARKPVENTVVDNVMKYRTGGYNIDACRIPLESNYEYKTTNRNTRQDDKVFNNKSCGFKSENNNTAVANPKGRYPSNVILTYDDTDYEEVCGGFPITGQSNNTGIAYTYDKEYDNANIFDNIGNKPNAPSNYNDLGSASRYFYCAKASNKDRDAGLKFLQNKHNTHPTVKPVELMQYLVRLVTAKGGVVLDPFMGSGSTGKAVMCENVNKHMNYTFIGIELEKEYCNIAQARMANIEGDIVREDEKHNITVEHKYKPIKLF